MLTATVNTPALADLDGAEPDPPLLLWAIDRRRHCTTVSTILYYEDVVASYMQVTDSDVSVILFQGLKVQTSTRPLPDDGGPKVPSEAQRWEMRSAGAPRGGVWGGAP